MLPLRRPKAWLAASALLVAGVILGSLLPGGPEHLPENFDKAEHFVSYLLLAVWFTGLSPRESYWKVAVGLIALGLCLEGLQAAMDLGRIPDALDVVANTVGVAFGIGVAFAATGGWARRFESWLSSS